MFNRLFKNFTLFSVLVIFLFKSSIYAQDFFNNTDADLTAIKKAHNFLKKQEETIKTSAIAAPIVFLVSWAAIDVMKNRILDLVWNDKRYADDVLLHFKEARNTSNFAYSNISVTYYKTSDFSNKVELKNLTVHGSKGVNSVKLMQLSKGTKVVAFVLAVAAGGAYLTKYILDIIFEDEDGVLSTLEIDSLKQERYNEFLAYDWDSVNSLDELPFQLVDFYQSEAELKAYIKILASIETEI